MVLLVHTNDIYNIMFTNRVGNLISLITGDEAYPIDASTWSQEYRKFGLDI